MRFFTHFCLRQVWVKKAYRPFLFLLCVESCLLICHYSKPIKEILQHLKTVTIELAEVPTPQLKEGHILVQSRTSLISRHGAHVGGVGKRPVVVLEISEQ
jgi:hypothetical protein